MKKNSAFVLAVLLTVSVPASAEKIDSTSVMKGKGNAPAAVGLTEPVFKFSSGNKHINVARLGLSPHTTVYEALQLFPEVLSRGYSDNLSTYSVSIDGFSLGVAKDEALYQMTISELKEIVISDDPTSSYDSDGVGGSINLVTKTVPDGLSGNGQLDVSTEKDVLVSTSINYRRPKLLLQGYIKAEYFDIGSRATVKNYMDEVFVSSVDSSYNTRGGGGQIKLALTYTPTDKDNLKVSFWQRYSNDIDTITEDSFVSEKLGTGSGTFVRLNYSHRFNYLHSLSINGSYSYTPVKSSDKDSKTFSLRWSRPHSANAAVDYSGKCYDDGSHSVLLKVGAKLDYSNTLTGPANPYRTDKFSIIPSTTFEWIYKDAFSLRLGGSYNFDHWRSPSSGKHKDTQDYKVWTELLGSPAPGHTLRLLFMRNQLPEVKWETLGYVLSTNLGYVLDLRRGDHLINLSAALKFDHTEVTREQTAFNVLSPQLSLFWQANWFSLGLAANSYVNIFRKSDSLPFAEDRATPRRAYGIVRLTPMFRLPKSWFLNATFMYNTGVFDINHVGGGYFFTAVRVGKKVGNWLLHAELSDPLHYRTKDIRYSGSKTVETLHYPEVRYLNVGVTCDF